MHYDPILLPAGLSFLLIFTAALIIIVYRMRGGR